MNFADLHELLRLELLRRIEAGSLSGNKLAQLTGFRQAHISNFLNQRRSLSLEGLNRVLDSQSLKIEDLLPLQIAASTGTAANQPLTQFQEAHVEPIEPIPVVTVAVALGNPKIHLTPTTECLHITASRLGHGLNRPSAKRQHWQRFVAIRVDAAQASAMAPLLTKGSLVILDRHYTSLAPNRPSEPNLYAVRSGNTILLRYIDLDDTTLILRPLSLEHPVHLITLPPSSGPHLPEHLVGRVCLHLAEL